MKQGWEIKKLGEVCTFCSGYTPKESELLECGDVPYFKVSDMNHCDNLKYLTHTSLFLEDGCKVYPKHTIVFPKNGAAIATNKKRILAQDSVVDLNTGGVVANDALVYFEYLYLYFLNLDFRLHTRRGAVPTLDIAELKNKSIPIPPREEQERIVAELDCLSGVIERKREQLRELDALAQSIFYQMFGDPITNEKRWEVKKLEEVCDVCSSRRVFVDELVEDGVPFYRGTEIGQMAEGEIIIPTLYITPDHYERLKEETGIPQIGDLLLPSICNDGRIWLVSTDAPYYFKDGRVLWIKCAGKIDGQFLRYQLKNIFINNYNKIASGTTFAELKIFILRELKINIPPLALQQEFAEKIDRIEQQKKLISQSIKETEDLFNSRMSYYFN